MNQSSPAKSPPVWSVPIAVADIPESGRHLELVADGRVRDAIGKIAGVSGLPRLEFSFDLKRQGSSGLRVVGKVTATVVQDCVVTLEPVESAIEEAVDVAFQPDAQPQIESAGLHGPDADEPPEALRDGVVDLGVVAMEFLLLGISPYPRKAGVLFDPPAIGDPSSHPFAALAALKKGGTTKPG